MSPETFQVIFNHGESKQLLFLPERPLQIIFKYTSKEIVLRYKDDKDGLFHLDSENSDYFSPFGSKLKTPSTCQETDINSELEEVICRDTINENPSSEIVSKKFHNQHTTDSDFVSTLSNSNNFSFDVPISSKDAKGLEFHKSSPSQSSMSSPTTGDTFSHYGNDGRKRVLSNESLIDSSDIPAKRMKTVHCLNLSVSGYEPQNSTCAEMPPLNSAEYFVVNNENVINSVIKDVICSMDSQSVELANHIVLYSTSDIDTNSVSDFSSIQKVPVENADTVVSNSSAIGIKNSVSVAADLQVSKTVDQEKVAESLEFSADSASNPGNEVDCDSDKEFFVVDNENVFNSVIKDVISSMDSQSVELANHIVLYSTSHVDTDSVSDFSSIQKVPVKNAPNTVVSNSVNAIRIKDSVSEVSKTVDQEKLAENLGFSDDSASNSGNEVDFDWDSDRSDNQSKETPEKSEDSFWKKTCAICLSGRTPLRCLHKFPKDPACSYKWAEITRKPCIKKAVCSERTKKYRICSDHFLATDYDQENYCLLSHAVPSVFLWNAHKVSDLNEVEKEVSNLLDGDKCPGINSDEDEDLQKSNQMCFRCALCHQYKTSRRVLHRFPPDPELSDRWAKVCDRNWITKATPTERFLKYRICMEHFQPSDHLKDNRLVPDAIPSRIPKPKPIVLKKTDNQIILSNGVIYQRASTAGDPQSSSQTKEFPSPGGVDKSFILSLKEKLRSVLKKNLNNGTEAQVSSQPLNKVNKPYAEPPKVVVQLLSERPSEVTKMSSVTRNSEMS